MGGFAFWGWGGRFRPPAPSPRSPQSAERTPNMQNQAEGQCKGRGHGARGARRGDAKSGAGKARAAKVARAGRSSPKPRAPTPRVVYLLVNRERTHTYIGSTPDLKRRLRQHNMEIAGGAWCTSIQVKMGSIWSRALHVKGFADDAAAYKFERDWKQVNKKAPRVGPVVWRKIAGLRQLIPRGATQPEVVWETIIDLTFDD